MSEKTPDSVSGNRLTRSAMAEMLASNFERLTTTDQKLFLYGPVYLAGNASLAGLISNSLYRRALNVTPAYIISALPMSVLPFLVTVTTYKAAVSIPLVSGDLNCPSCVMLRGALIGAACGGLYPILLALPVNICLAIKYNTAPMPERTNALRYWADLSRPILRKLRAVMVLQAFFGTYLSSRHFETYTKLAQITFGSDRDELKDESDLS